MSSNPRSRMWTVVVNDTSEKNIERLKSIFSAKHWTFHFGYELAPTTGHPHLQGYIKHKNAIAFDTLKKIMPSGSFRASKGNEKQNYKYADKDQKIVLSNTEIPLDPEEEYDAYMHEEYDDVKWHDWQQQIIDIIESKPDKRIVHWFWEEKGGVGKSFLIQYLDWKYNAIIANGKQSDVFNQYKTYVETVKRLPKLALIDVPRSHKEYICYSTFETIKNGLFFSGKYEGGKLRLKPHHLIIFANFEPDYSKLSEDRWNVVEI